MTTNSVLRPHQEHCLTAWQTALQNADVAKDGGIPAPLPDRNDLTPFQLRPALGWVAIIEKTAEAYRYRLIGTHMVLRTGFDMTGKTVPEFPKRWQREMLQEAYEAVEAARKPLVCVRTYTGLKVFGDHSVLLLPCAGSDQKVNRILSIMAPLDQEPAILVKKYSALSDGHVAQKIMSIDTALGKSAA